MILLSPFLGRETKFQSWYLICSSHTTSMRVKNLLLNQIYLMFKSQGVRPENSLNLLPWKNIFSHFVLGAFVSLPNSMPRNWHKFLVPQGLPSRSASYIFCPSQICFIRYQCKLPWWQLLSCSASQGPHTWR